MALQQDSTQHAQHALKRFGLAGSNALVTGGSRGIGHAICTELASLGARVLTCGRDEETLTAAVAEWKAQGLDVDGVVGDVSSEAGRENLLTAVKQKFGDELHILVNNAGKNIRKPTTEYTSADFHDLLSTNLESAFALCQLTLPLLKAARGCVVMNSSVAGGPTAINTGALYAMSKAAMNQLTRNLACEWAPHGVRVNAVAPWYTATELAQQVLKDDDYRKQVLDVTPSGRVGEPEEVAGVVAFLCSKAASYTTGQVIQIDGAAMISSFRY